MKERKEHLGKRERQREAERVIWNWDSEDGPDAEPENDKLLSDEEYFTEERMRRQKIIGIVVFVLILVLFAAITIFIKMKQASKTWWWR
ncbi:MAG: hypothetical protein ILP09_03235 [Oscillospiraceae bacterium]|nr:hypothetical protein [Oscillospiraceae bacterium]